MLQIADEFILENGENSKRTEEFLAEMSNVDLNEFGVTDQSKIYSNGVVCVSETMVRSSLFSSY